MRLDRYLANSGIGTRKKVKEIILSKKIKVNDNIIISSDFNVSDKDIVTYNGNIIKYKKYVYIMLNKPKNYISATFDNLHKTVIDLIDGYETFNLFPIGRLDIDTEGLILLTNDGKFSHNLMSPRKHIFKTYYVKLKFPLSITDKEKIEVGIKLDDGYITKKSKISIIDEYSLEIEISEGKYHQIKRMFKAVFNEVIYLKRIKIGNLILDDNLKLGEYRELSERELNNLL